MTQEMQIIVQNRLVGRILGSDEQIQLPWPVKLIQRWPLLRRIPARVIGIGFRAEHVRTPDARQ